MSFYQQHSKLMCSWQWALGSYVCSVGNKFHVLVTDNITSMMTTTLQRCYHEKVLSTFQIFHKCRSQDQSQDQLLTLRPQQQKLGPSPVWPTPIYYWHSAQYWCLFFDKVDNRVEAGTAVRVCSPCQKLFILHMAVRDITARDMYSKCLLYRADSYIHTSHRQWSNGACTMSSMAFLRRSFAFFTEATESICGEAMPSAWGHLWSRITDRHFLCRSCIAQWAQNSNDRAGYQADISSWYSTPSMLHVCTVNFNFRRQNVRRITPNEILKSQANRAVNHQSREHHKRNQLTILINLWTMWFLGIVLK